MKNCSCHRVWEGILKYSRQVSRSLGVGEPYGFIGGVHDVGPGVNMADANASIRILLVEPLLHLINLVCDERGRRVTAVQVFVTDLMRVSNAGLAKTRWRSKSLP